MCNKISCTELLQDKDILSLILYFCNVNRINEMLDSVTSLFYWAISFYYKCVFAEQYLMFISKEVCYMEE